MNQPNLIGDCLIHVFTFLTEGDLISASSVCSVRGVKIAEVVDAILLELILKCNLLCCMIFSF